MFGLVEVPRSDPQRRRELIVALEESINGTGDAIHELPTRHHFAHGTYSRELHLPAGVVATGKIHRYSCINIIAKGSLLIFTEEGDYEVTAPFTFVSGPGVKKAGFALTDVVWITAHPWDGPEDVALVEKEIIVPSFAALADEQNETLESGK
jgi:hypothetical protein